MAVGLLAALIVPVTASADTPPPVPPLPQTIDLHLPAHPSSEDLARAQKVVNALVRRADAQAQQVEHAAGKAIAQRVVLRQVSARKADALKALSAQVRQSYIAGGGGDPLLSFLAGIEPSDDTAATIGLQRAIGVDGDVVREAQAADAADNQATSSAEALQRRLLKDSQPALLLLAQAGEALDQAKQAFASDQTALAALQAQQAALFSTSSALSYAVTPAAGTIGAAAQAEQAPILALLEKTPFGQLPQGFAQAGDGLAGVASWYGPGFVGNNTSSGSPYDPEQLTCAMLAVPLGTVVRVTNQANGKAISLLVTDHGPYVDGRIIDLSQRAALLLGLSLGPVTVEPLQRA